MSTLGTVLLSPDVEVGSPVLSTDFLSWLLYFFWFLLAPQSQLINEELIYRVFLFLTYPARNDEPVFSRRLIGVAFLGGAFSSRSAIDLRLFLYRMAFGILAGMITSSSVRYG